MGCIIECLLASVRGHTIGYTTHDCNREGGIAAACATATVDKERHDGTRVICALEGGRDELAADGSEKSLSEQGGLRSSKTWSKKYTTYIIRQRNTCKTLMVLVFDSIRGGVRTILQTVEGLGTPMKATAIRQNRRNEQEAGDEGEVEAHSEWVVKEW